MQDNLYRQYSDGLLEEEIFRSIENAIRSEVAPYRIAREHWARANIAYSDAYRTLVNDILDENSSNADN
jgi:hypothetical protein